MKSDRVYITTTLPYVNADPHVGFAMEIIRADALARYHRLIGNQVFFNTGTDEHGAKIYGAAMKEGVDPKPYADRYAAKFRELKGLLNLSVDNFIRTTDTHHVVAAQEFWKRCDVNGDIEKKFYKIKYCTGCELEKTDSELENSRCPLHPNRDLEIREEENYFFKFSNYTEKLKDFYMANPTFVIPDFRFNEVKALLDRGLEDFSISRLKSRMPWGVVVPGDDDHVMYVWFDALINYISAIGWPACAEASPGKPDHQCGRDSFDQCTFMKWWPKEGGIVQYCGKDNIRQQAAMWQAMLMSAKLPNSKQIVIDGFINSGGQKMSKSLGNVINPYDVIETFKGVTDFPEDVLRFVLLHDMPSFEDGDLTMESIRASYAAHLQNGLGNLVSRIMKMAVTHLPDPVVIPANTIPDEWRRHIESFDHKRAMELVMEYAKKLDEKIQKTEPFKLIKNKPEEARALITELVVELYTIGRMLNPFLPKTNEMIKGLIHKHQMPEKPLFARLS